MLAPGSESGSTGVASKSEGVSILLMILSSYCLNKNYSDAEVQSTQNDHSHS
jgi:hypothetical protein